MLKYKEAIAKLHVETVKVQCKIAKKSFILITVNFVHNIEAADHFSYNLLLYTDYNAPLLVFS